MRMDARAVLLVRHALLQVALDGVQALQDGGRGRILGHMRRDSRAQGGLTHGGGGGRLRGECVARGGVARRGRGAGAMGNAVPTRPRVHFSAGIGVGQREWRHGRGIEHTGTRLRRPTARIPVCHVAWDDSPASLRPAYPHHVRRRQPRGAVPPPGPPRPGGAARRRAERARSGQGVWSCAQKGALSPRHPWDARGRGTARHAWLESPASQTAGRLRRAGVAWPWACGYRAPRVVALHVGLASLRDCGAGLRLRWARGRRCTLVTRSWHPAGAKGCRACGRGGVGDVSCGPAPDLTLGPPSVHASLQGGEEGGKAFGNDVVGLVSKNANFALLGSAITKARPRLGV